jgi:hypothetical protein
MHLEEYQDLARQTAGRALKVRLASPAATPAPAAPAAPSPADVKREQLLKEAAREPAVQDTLDLFGGKVVDVKEAKA